MINQYALMEVLQKYRNDSVVVSTMSGNTAWFQTSHLPARDVPVGGAMGKASSFALGIALAQPNIKVLVIDGDGSLEMNLGSLVTIAGERPENLYHFVLENGMYAVTGGQPIPGADLVSFTDMSKAAGYAAAYEFDNLEDFAVQVEGVLSQKGPVFVAIKTEPEIQSEPIGRRVRPAGVRSTTTAIHDLRESLGTQ
jgi:phosphonopyruvate decarboxylase